MQRCRRLSIYPGGEVMCWRIEKEDEYRVPKNLRNKLLTEVEVRERLEGKRVNEE